LGKYPTTFLSNKTAFAKKNLRIHRLLYLTKRHLKPIASAVTVKRQKKGLTCGGKFG